MTLSTTDDPFWRNDEATVRLCCLSPDGRFMHSLHMSPSRVYMIQSRRRPFTEDHALIDYDASNFSALLRTDLPDELQASLRIDPPIEMFALRPYGDQRDRSPLEPIDLQVQEKQDGFSACLCVYSRKNVFQLTLSSTNASARLPRHSAAPFETEGQVVATMEPFQQVLSGDPYSWPALNIVRVRPAPTYEDGYAVLSPPGSLAMLTYNHDTCTYALTLYHAGLLNHTRSSCLRTSDHCTTPFEFRMEEVHDGSDQGIIDFCFARSCELPLFTSMTVLFARGSGEIMAASPILFHGAIIKNSMLEEGLEYLEGQLDCLARRTSQWNQCRVAKQYLLDILPSGPMHSRLRTVDLSPNAPPSAQWPVQAQGPIMYPSREEPGPHVCAIECVGNFGLVGLAIATDQGQVEFFVVSPTAVLPRFTFESKDDSYVLDGALISKSTSVEKVVLEVETNESSAKPTNAFVGLIQDPIFDNLIHVFTQTAVFTISTYAIHNASQRILACADSINQSKTTAWPCIKGTTLRGIVVSDDRHAGHEIVAQSASDGRVICVSVPQAQAAHQIQSHISEPCSGPLALGMASLDAPDNALKVLESTTPLHEVIGSLMEKIERGLAGLSKIVGSETKMNDITFDKLAVMQQFQERCSEDLVLPLLELKKDTALRDENLKMIVNSQKQQLSNLLRIQTSLEKQKSSIRQSLVSYEANAAMLMDRCASALVTIKDLSLTITDAEWNFAQDIKRIENKCTKIQEALMDILASQAVLDRDSLNVDIDPNLTENAEIMLKYSATSLDQVRTRLSADEEIIQRILE